MWNRDPMEWATNFLLAIMIIFLIALISTLGINKFYPIKESGIVTMKAKTVNGNFLNTSTDFLVTIDNHTYTLSPSDYAQIKRGDRITVKTPRFNWVHSESELLK